MSILNSPLCSPLMEQAGAPTAEPEPGGLQPAGATEDGGVLWTCSLNSPAPDPNDIRRHVSSLQPSLPCPLSCCTAPSLPSLFSLSLSLQPSSRSCFLSPLSFAAAICLSPPSPASPLVLCLGEEVEPVWWRGARLCHTCLLMSSCSACHRLWQSQNGRHISHCWALICLVCEWLAWWLHCGIIPSREKKGKKNKKKKNKNRRNDVTRCLWWEIFYSCFSLLHRSGTVNRVVVLVSSGVKIRACLMGSSLSSAVCRSHYSFRGFSFSIFPTWTGDIWCQGISTAPVND